jgi:four helix bundle protein
MATNNILFDKSFVMAVAIVTATKHIIENKKEYVLTKQLVRSGTAVGALIRESKNAESTKDFIHKLSIAQKECDETIYWLLLLKETHYLNEVTFIDIHDQANQILKMIKSSIITLKSKLKNSQASNNS